MKIAPNSIKTSLQTAQFTYDPTTSTTSNTLDVLYYWFDGFNSPPNHNMHAGVATWIIDTNFIRVQYQLTTDANITDYTHSQNNAYTSTAIVELLAPDGTTKLKYTITMTANETYTPNASLATTWTYADAVNIGPSYYGAIAGLKITQSYNPGRSNPGVTSMSLGVVTPYQLVRCVRSSF